MELLSLESSRYVHLPPSPWHNVGLITLNSDARTTLTIMWSKPLTAGVSTAALAAITGADPAYRDISGAILPTARGRDLEI